MRDIHKDPTTEMMIATPGNPDPESPSNANFDCASVRQGFVRKVYSTFMVQLPVMTVFIALFSFYEPIVLWRREHSMFGLEQLAGYLVNWILSFNDSALRNSPSNIIFLMLLTAGEGYLLGTADEINMAGHPVLFATGATTVICFALMMSSFQKKIEFTRRWTYLFVAIIALFISGFFPMFLPIWTTVYVLLGTLIFSSYLVYETKRLVKGECKFTVSPREYIFATIKIQAVIIDLFNLLCGVITVVPFLSPSIVKIYSSLSTLVQHHRTGCVRTGDADTVSEICWLSWTLESLPYKQLLPHEPPMFRLVQAG